MFENAGGGRSAELGSSVMVLMLFDLRIRRRRWGRSVSGRRELREVRVFSSRLRSVIVLMGVWDDGSVV